MTASSDRQEMAGAEWGLFVGVSLIWGASFLLIAESLVAYTPGVVAFGRAGLGRPPSV